MRKREAETWTPAGLKLRGAGYWILISEGDDGFREALRNVFEKEGFSVTTVHFAEEALAMLEESDYDLVVSDIEIRTEGKTHLIQEMRRKRDCPILLLTRGGCEIQGQCEVLEPGKVECLVKPVKRKDLLSHVYRLLEKGIL